MRNTILIFVTVILLSGCQPYRVTVQQGNILDKKLVSKLSVGMSKNQVESLLGTPVLTNTFDHNTWTYVSTKQVNGGAIERQKLIIKFKNDKLVQLH